MIKTQLILKYLLRNNFNSILLILFFSCSLFFLVDLVELMRRGSSKNISMEILIFIAFLHLPSLFTIILPTTFLLAVMHTYMKLNKNNELSIIRGAGISFWMFLLPGIINALFFSVLYVLFFNPVFAQMTVKFKSYESIYFKGSSGLHTVSPTGLWLKEVTENNEYVINSSHYSPNEKKLLNVKIFEFDKKDNFLRRIDSNQVMMFTDRWDLYGVNVVELNKIPLNYSKMSLNFDLSIEKIEQNFRSADTISFWKLNKYINTLKNSGFNANKHIIYYNYLLSYPLILISMVLVGFTLSIQRQRKKKNFFNILIGILSGIIFHFLTDIFRTIGENGKLSTFLSVWAVPCIFILILLSYLIHVEDG